MDPKISNTLDLIQQALDEMLENKQIDMYEYSYQYCLVIFDYWEDGQFKKAISLFQKLDPYFLKSIKRLKYDKTENGIKLYKLYQELGLEFWVPTISKETN